ncbi:uncharacterized protein LOC132708352 isoform X1 [Cylas formicarius]|uniref:uncharacterized protein LOC132708352 isoform X1 n=1 Tax=Cylas formicarius TaxID=197179 RepID=UPI00295838D9|nr:uncharacterized protein LOC132708352 isoform X1 [Cylas formicarius]
MDEIIFRSSQRLENVEMQVQLVSSKMKDLINAYLQQSRALIYQVWNSTKIEHMRLNMRELLNYLLAAAHDFKEKAVDVADPKRLYMFLKAFVGGRWSKREISLVCIGFLFGGLVGLTIGLSVRRKESTIRYMEAVQLNQYLGIESVAVVEDAIAPHECGDYDVLIDVKAASVQIIDAEICKGYGKTLRKILRRIFKQSSSDLPVILGRDCTGVITDLGEKIKRLEIGDEVWATVPFWSQGTLSQTVLLSENRVAKKPKNVGFEGACSIPYAGSIALSILNQAKLDVSNAEKKKIFIQGGCTPVGCLLIQILKHWKAEVVTSCCERAVPVAKALGAADIITLDTLEEFRSKIFLEHEYENNEHSNDQVDLIMLIKELELRGQQYDVIILTRNDRFNWKHLTRFCKKEKSIFSSLPPDLLSDSCGIIGRNLLSLYIKTKMIMQTILGAPLDDYDECHLCYETLNDLTHGVENGYLQNVVDKVFQPKNIEMALNHIQSSKSIGSSVITFR